MTEKKKPRRRRASVAERPHDGLFQYAMGTPIVAREFLSLLPSDLVAQLDQDSVEPTNSHFVQEDFRHLYSDCLYRIKLRNGRPAHLYLLNEHLSQPDPLIAFRLAEYTLAAWSEIIRAAEAPLHKLPLVIPVLIYNGNKPYPRKVSLPDLMDVPEVMQVWSMRQPVHVLSLCKVSDARLAEAAHLGAAFLALKHAYDTMPFETIFIQLGKMAEQHRQPFLTAILNYIMSIRDDVSLERLEGLVEVHTDEKGETVMTLAEQLRQERKQEYEAQGEARGEAKGEAKGLLTAALNLLKSGCGLEMAQSITGLSKAVIENAWREQNSPS